ncbi:cell wall-active antibiotics response protein LiaF [Paenibacillus qinlingensis]|uniref:Lia operon protein LiaF n=1 Tax=Paenibacillus qinlingensis TaxID=1837343 RepID=A0ABU1P431_9BACL|nr:cell wall-active antibiotics response protein LiaF [Paenibacillus qinlingensis]MDR6554515.1 lia operon protein LiaF [Paenibacillus qinlingensis]
MNPHMLQRVIWGLVLVSAGTLFLLNQLGIVQVDIGYLFSTYWPAILICYGLIGFVSQRKYHWGGSIGSLLMCGVGTIFLLKNLNLTDLSIGEMFKFLAPVALIFFGLHVIFRPGKKESPDWPSIKKAKEEERQARREAHRMRHAHHKKNWESAAWNMSKDVSSNPKEYSDHSATSNVKHGLTEEEKEVLKDIHGTYPLDNQRDDWQISDEIDAKEKAGRAGQPKTNSFDNDHQHKYDGFVRNFDSGNVLHRHGFIGDVHLGQEAWELKPVQISHFIGDSVIDLTRASIPRGETTIHVTAFIGDVKIFIPNDMDVEVRVMASSFIGDMKVLDRRESGFLRNIRTQTTHYEEAEHKIVVTTSMFIGDITIKKIG